MWLTVQWLDVQDDDTKYGVISISSVSMRYMNVFIGKKILIGKRSREKLRRALVLEMSEDKREAMKKKKSLLNEDTSLDYVPFWNGSSHHKQKTFKRNHSIISNYNDAVPGPSNSPMPRTITENRSSSNDSEHAKNTHTATSIHSIEDIRQSIKNFTRDLTRPEKIRTPDRKVTIYKEKETQTDFDESPNVIKDNTEQIENLERKLITLYEKFQNLALKLDLNNHDVTENDVHEINITRPDNLENQDQLNDHNPEHALHAENGSDYENGNSYIISDQAIQNLQVGTSRVKNPLNGIEKTPERNFIKCESITLGKGNAEISSRLYSDINWESYTSATRQLLQAVFPRRILATHSLTGKQSPAFLNRPAKKILDPKIVDDIVTTVSEKCRVPQKLVRTCITIKCADEAKLYRNRQKSRSKQNEENLPPVDNFEQNPQEPTL